MNDAQQTPVRPGPGSASDTGFEPAFSEAAAPGNTFVLPEHKMLYVSVTKVACTSLRWMVADLVGEDLESFWTGPAAHQTRLMTIHRNRTHWQKAPQLFKLSPQERDQISRDNGWLVFCVVRDPWSRLWSGWQSKFLVQHSFYVRHWGDQPWFPRVPTSQADVIEDWTRFVEAEPWLHDERLSEDVHFKTQAYSVRPHSFRYSRIYDLPRLSELFDDIHSHLAGLGLDQDLYLPRANETPLPMIPAVLEGGLAEAIRHSYREDFEEFGDRWSLDAIRYKADSWSHDAIEHTGYHTVANERIGDLSQTTKQLSKQLARAEGRVEQLEAELAEREGRRRAGPAATVRDRLARLVRP